MAAIHVLSSLRCNGAQLRRLHADLTEAHASDAALVSRVPHIRAAAATLRQMRDQLQEAIDALLKEAGVDENDPAKIVFRDYYDDLDVLITFASRFPDHDQGVTAGK